MKKQNIFDTFYESIMDDVMYGQAGSEKEFEADIEATGAVPEDTESMDASANITEQIGAKAAECVDCITNIFALVEDKGQEMFDKQAAEKLEDIIEHASNALRELNNRLD